MMFLTLITCLILSSASADLTNEKDLINLACFSSIHGLEGVKNLLQSEKADQVIEDSIHWFCNQVDGKYDQCKGELQQLTEEVKAKIMRSEPDALYNSIGFCPRDYSDFILSEEYIQLEADKCQICKTSIQITKLLFTNSLTRWLIGLGIKALCALSLPLAWLCNAGLNALENLIMSFINSIDEEYVCKFRLMEVIKNHKQ